MPAEILQPGFLPGSGRGEHHLRVDVVVDLEQAVLFQVAEVLLVGIGGLQVGGRHGPAAGGDAAGGVVAENLDDVVLPVAGAQETPSLGHMGGDVRVVEDAAVEVLVEVLAGLHHVAHHFHRVHPSGPEGQGRFHLLAGGAADDQHLGPGAPLERMAQIDALGAETPSRRPRQGVAQRSKISVKRIDEAGLAAAVVGHVLAFESGSGLLADDVDLADRVPVGPVQPSLLDITFHAALDDVLLEIEVLVHLAAVQDRAGDRQGHDDQAQSDKQGHLFAVVGEQGCRDQTETTAEEHDSARADAGNERDEDQAARGRAHQVPEVEFLDPAGITGEQDGDDQPGKKEGQGDERIDEQKEQAVSDRGVMEVVEVERDGVEHRQDEEIRQAEQDGQPHQGAGGILQRTAPLQREIDPGQAETEHDHGDDHVGHVGVPDHVEHADQGQFHHQGGHGDQQQAKGNTTHNKTPCKSGARSRSTVNKNLE